ncbi:SDR family NAD(P)-dependent oxidoreductase [Tsukamurella sp. NPDC003166]|uniref:SDR family NAD(P)-dependent oxidoreductase n=1 Tax=Tsukamurella sp. NPDC003166 TaxID=3154444 RepID=UPI0033B690A3
MTENRNVTVVTGTSSGMGLHAAVELARRGHTVVGIVRRPGSETELLAVAAAAGVDIAVRHLDVSDHAAAAVVFADIERELGPISTLINNAGRGKIGTAEQLTVEDVRRQIEINYIAPVALTKLVLPGMRERGAGTILTVTSVGGVVAHPFLDAYAGSKFAIEGFLQSLAPVAAEFGVRVSVIEPGYVSSPFGANSGGAPEAGAYGELMATYFGNSGSASPQNPESAGIAIADAATAAEYHFRYQTASEATELAGVSLADLDGDRAFALTSRLLALP